MKFRKFLLSVLLASAVFSCKKNESNELRLRDHAEVATENDQAIQTFLKSHSYTLNENSEVSFEKITPTSANKTPLSEKVKTLVVKVKTPKDEFVPHNLYYLILKEGEGEQSSQTDRVYVTYQLQNLKGDQIENAKKLNQSNWFELLNDRRGNGTILGFRHSVALLKDSGKNAIENPDGTISEPSGYGQGIFFLPSGVAYFSNTLRGESYAPLIYTIKLLKTQKTDHDRDGILTNDEIIINPDGTIETPDCNKNGTPDYLDPKKCN